MNSKPFTAYAVCVPESIVPGINVVTQSERIPVSQPTHVVPKCTNGKAIGGGWRGSSVLIRTQPNYGNDLRSWLVTVRRDYTGPAPTVDAYAICVPDGGLKSLEAKSGHRIDSSKQITVQAPSCADGTYLLGGGAGVPDDQYDHNFWTHMRNSGGGTNRNGPWTVGLLLDVPPWLPNPKRDVYSIAMCGAFKVDQKTSGKNPGWGDGEGGGRSKEGVGVDPAQEDAPTTTTAKGGLT